VLSEAPQAPMAVCFTLFASVLVFEALKSVSPSYKVPKCFKLYEDHIK
jgi:hypothetical protein